jgi:hypothetical protein
MDYGAKCDGITLTDAVVSAGGTNLQSTSATFTSADTGKRFILQDGLHRTTSAAGAITSGTNTLTGSNFQNYDVGNPITINGAGVAGANLTTTITSYTDSTHVIIAVNASTTVSSATLTIGGIPLNGTITFVDAHNITLSVAADWAISNGIYVYGSGDQSAINNCVTALNSAGGGTLFIPGVSLVTANINLNSSNVIVTGLGYKKSQVIAATNTISPFNIDATSTKGIENISFRDLKIDCANQNGNQGAIVIKGGTFSNGDYVKTIDISKVYLANLGVPDQGLVQIYSGRGSTDRGPVSDITMTNCIFDGSVKYHFYVNGQNCSSVKWSYCRFINSQGGCIAWNTTGESSASLNTSIRSNEDWQLSHCYFNNNMLTLNSTIGMIQDVSKNGLRGLEIDHCFVDGAVSTSEHYFINIHESWGVKLHHNIFWKFKTILSIGQHNTSLGLAPSMFYDFSYNLVYKCFNIADHDASIFGNFDHNILWELQIAGGLGAYSRQWPSKWTNNTVYNCPTAPTSPNNADINVAALQFTPGGIEINNNTFIDDRALPTPTTAPSLTAVSSASTGLGARTYFVKYTWVNDSGETAPSSEASLALTDLQLLKVTHPTYSDWLGSAQVPPSGAKKVNIYISTTTNTETLQDFMNTSWQNEQESSGYPLTNGAMVWTQPASTLVAGAALPTINTTHSIAVYGFYETSGGLSAGIPNIFENNKFYGIPVPVLYNSSYARINRNNLSNGHFSVYKRTTDAAITSGAAILTSSTAGFVSGDVGKSVYIIGAAASGGLYYGLISSFTSATQVTLNTNAGTTVSGASLVFGTPTAISNSTTSIIEKIPYNQGSVTGATTFDIVNGETISATLTGNITVTFGAGDYVGQEMTLTLTQDSTGSRTVTWPANFKKAGGTLTLSTGANTIDTIRCQWDGVNWLERFRLMGLA